LVYRNSEEDTVNTWSRVPQDYKSNAKNLPTKVIFLYMTYIVQNV
jgi:hypothetical protein